jgi:hypothetical protein
VSRGGIERALIMGVGWSSTFFVGCAFSHFILFLPRRCLIHRIYRICLEELGVVQESDHAALVLNVFWRLVSQSMVLLSLTFDCSFKIHSGDAHCTVYVLVGACRFARGMGIGRLSFPSIFIWVGTTTR